MKLLPFIVAGASALIAPSTTTSSFTPAAGPSTWNFPKAGVSGIHANSGNTSRPRRIPGETFSITSSIGSTSQFEVGDLIPTRGPRPSFESDILLGAALVFGANQSPTDRNIQKIVAENFDAYWD